MIGISRSSDDDFILIGQFLGSVNTRHECTTARVVRGKKTPFRYGTASVCERTSSVIAWLWSSDVGALLEDAVKVSDMTSDDIQ